MENKKELIDFVIDQQLKMGRSIKEIIVSANDAAVKSFEDKDSEAYEFHVSVKEECIKRKSDMSSEEGLPEEEINKWNQEEYEIVSSMDDQEEYYEYINKERNKIELGLIEIYNSLGKPVPKEHEAVLNNLYNILFDENI